MDARLQRAAAEWQAAAWRRDLTPAEAQKLLTWALSWLEAALARHPGDPALTGEPAGAHTPQAILAVLGSAAEMLRATASDPAAQPIVAGRVADEISLRLRKNLVWLRGTSLDREGRRRLRALRAAQARDAREELLPLLLQLLAEA